MVTKVASHPNPARRPRPSFMLRAALDNVGPGDNFEQLWTKRVGENLFEINCIPFFAYDLALDDIVHADAESGYVIQSVVRRSGNGVVRVAIVRSEDVEAVHPRLRDLLDRLGYLCEWFAPGYGAISVGPGVAHDELFKGLAGLGDAIEVERVMI